VVGATSTATSTAAIATLMQALTAGCHVQLRRHIRESPTGGTSSHRAVFRDSFSLKGTLGFGARFSGFSNFEVWAFILL
jgi:hypothetical protein